MGQNHYMEQNYFQCYKDRKKRKCAINGSIKVCPMNGRLTLYNQ
jgi:hypothetical protein